MKFSVSYYITIYTSYTNSLIVMYHAVSNIVVLVTSVIIQQGTNGLPVRTMFQPSMFDDQRVYYTMVYCVDSDKLVLTIAATYTDKNHCKLEQL